MTDDSWQSGMKRARRAVGDLLGRGVALQAKALDQSVQTWRFAAYNTNAWLKSSVLPAADSVVAMTREMGESLAKTVRGDQGVSDLVHDAADRLDAAWRYARLVQTVGKRAFGTATFTGERVLAETPRYRLSHLPPRGPDTGLALFHAGGAIPYGDRIFRFTPEYNFFDRFLERGVTVYAMELLGDRHDNAIGAMTMEELVEDVVHLSDVAFEHHGRRKMALEGYCGHGTQTLAYVLARPEDADRKFHTFAMFVAPVDGRRCKLLAESTAATPDALREVQLRLWSLFRGYVPGDALRVGLDSALGTYFYKTPLGYFSAGFKKPSLAHVGAGDALDPREVRELAGAYWISPDCGRRFPVPLAVARFTTPLFTDGVAPTGDLSVTVGGEALTLRALVERTGLRVVGFYGGLDEVIPDQTAHALISVLGERYRHVVHPQAGHISYVLSPTLWKPTHPAALKPNPVDVLLETAAAAASADGQG